MNDRLIITSSVLAFFIAGFALFFAVQGKKDVVKEFDAVNRQLVQLAENSNAASVNQLPSESTRLPAFPQQQVDTHEPINSPPTGNVSLDEIYDSLQALQRTVQELEYRVENDDALATLQREIQEIKQSIRSTPVIFSVTRLTPEEIQSATETLIDPGTEIGSKLEMLRNLRTADARSDQVVRHMANAYYSTEDPNQRADIFRQLDGVTAVELRAPLLYALENETAPQVREEAAETLHHYLPDPDVQRWLEFVAENDPNERVRVQAAQSLRGEGVQ
jgi:hypothetical protein